MSTKVNLDALIPREDFEIETASSQSQTTSTVQIRDLEESSFFYPNLRKPDFQRETADWDVEKIVSFLRSFLDGDLIPAIILWQSGQTIFVIDGAHRLGALAAWVHDDFGDGKISRDFFDERVPDEQLKVADKARRAVNKSIGSYEELQFAVSNAAKSKLEHVARAKNLATLALQLQWVRGNAKKAEKSFLKINQQAAPIDKTELQIIEHRQKPNALSARAILRAGTGHKYWKKFNDTIQDEVEKIAKEINQLLFRPALETPIKTLDLPVGGRGFNSRSLRLIFDLVNLVNRPASELADDVDGTETLKFIKKTKKVVQRITGDHPGCLGLHPAIFFYSASGRHQPTAFLAAIELVRDYADRKQLKNFTSIRNRFEEFLAKYKSISNQITVKWGSGVKGYDRLKELYDIIIDQLRNEKSEDEIVEYVRAHNTFGFVRFEEHNFKTDSKQFSTETKSAAFLREALSASVKCDICNGHIHKNSISIDHDVRKSEGGTGSLENAKLTHPYCNTSIKN